MCALACLRPLAGVDELPSPQARSSPAVLAPMASLHSAGLPVSFASGGEATGGGGDGDGGRELPATTTGARVLGMLAGLTDTVPHIHEARALPTRPRDALRCSRLTPPAPRHLAVLRRLS